MSNLKEWLLNTAIALHDKGYVVIPHTGPSDKFPKGCPATSFRSGVSINPVDHPEAYQADNISHLSIVTGLSRDGKGVVLVDVDGNHVDDLLNGKKKPDEDASDAEIANYRDRLELAKSFRIVPSLKSIGVSAGRDGIDKPVQYDDAKRSIHYLFKLPAGMYSSSLKSGITDIVPFIDVKSGIALMHIKPHKTLAIPAADKLEFVPNQVLTALMKRTVSPDFMSDADANAEYDDWEESEESRQRLAEFRIEGLANDLNILKTPADQEKWARLIKGCYTAFHKTDYEHDALELLRMFSDESHQSVRQHWYSTADKRNPVHYGFVQGIFRDMFLASKPDKFDCAKDLELSALHITYPECLLAGTALRLKFLAFAYQTTGDYLEWLRTNDKTGLKNEHFADFKKAVAIQKAEAAIAETETAIAEEASEPLSNESPSLPVELVGSDAIVVSAEELEGLRGLNDEIVDDDTIGVVLAGMGNPVAVASDDSMIYGTQSATSTPITLHCAGIAHVFHVETSIAHAEQRENAQTKPKAAKPKAAKPKATAPRQLNEKDHRTLYPHVKNMMIGKMAANIAGSQQLPVDSCFLMALSIVSAVFDSVFCCEWQDGGKFPLGVYALAEADAGSGKSSMIGRFADPAIEAWNEMIGEEHNMPPLFVGDATTAALNSHQIRKGGHLGYLTSEQSAMDSMFGGFEAKDKKPNMATILGAWSGDYAAVARVQRESFTAKGHGAMCVFSQAGTIDTIHRHSGNQGLIERFLCKSEKGFVGSRDFSKREAIKQDWFDIWRKVCESLFERVKAQLDHDRKKLFAKLGGESPVNNVELAQNEPDAFTNAAPDDVEESSPYSHKPKGVNVSKRTGDKLLLEDIEVNMPPFTNNQPVRLTEWQWNDLRAYRQELEPHLHVEHGKYGADGVRGFGMKMETHVVKIAVTLDLFDISMNKKQAQARDYVEQDNYIAAKAIFATLLDEMTNMLESKGLKKNPPHEEVVIDLIIRRTADNKDCDESILVNSLIGPIKTKTGVLMGKPAIRKLLRSMVESGKLTKDSDSDYQIVDC